jgi:leader peptidase (prepilin peptidase)/N-methyltransferase
MPTDGSVSASAAEIVMLAVGGLVIGSFINVVAYRLPRGESIVKPRSRCPSCGRQIAAYDNVPLVSWLLLRGRCRHCKASISVRYPLIEAATAALFVGVGIQHGTNPELWPGLAFMAMLVAVTAVDLEHRIVPNKVLAPAAVLALILWALADTDRLPENLLAAAAAGGAFLLVNLVYPRGMGMGDVKLAAVMGLYLGASVGAALAIAVVAGAIGGLAAARLAGVDSSGARKFEIPFAPFMALGGVIAQFAGEDLVHAYLRASGLE